VKPPSSCRLNPIEPALSKLKARIVKAADRIYEELRQAVGHVCNQFTDDQCYYFFKTAGYQIE
jgi:hypothetical protein